MFGITCPSRQCTTLRAMISLRGHPPRYTAQSPSSSPPPCTKSASSHSAAFASFYLPAKILRSRTPKGRSDHERDRGRVTGHIESLHINDVHPIDRGEVLLDLGLLHRGFHAKDRRRHLASSAAMKASVLRRIARKRCKGAISYVWCDARDVNLRRTLEPSWYVFPGFDRSVTTRWAKKWYLCFPMAALK